MHIIYIVLVFERPGLDGQPYIIWSTLN